ncbi:M20/M25/M40 family metallo-hydrolase [Sulfurimonas sp. HSL3-7]|uniref:M20/M25/M40 family metallo-hydrolase n=1 Tax=Sulfonitrofixus jiaomeiensis TaxID=3131938 RepID=UPI0031F897BB
MSDPAVLKHFKKICQIPHCSYETEAMKVYLSDLCTDYGYVVTVDDANNILAKKEGSKVTLQAHYDMVCIGVEYPLVLREKEGWLSADDSTLGADNGMGMAMMLSMMEAGEQVDCLFTAEEEVGLLGARGLALELATPYLLNLDSEEEGTVTIGCAGGVDIIATKQLRRYKKKLHLYEYHIAGLAGGHSGVDIDKNIPNAISLLFKKLCASESYIVEVNGGERRNSIPKKADVVFGLESYEVIEDALYLGEKEVAVMGESCTIIEMLSRFDSGVRGLNKELNIVQTSINLALIESSENALRVQLSGRSMDHDELKNLENETGAYFENEGFDVVSEGFYSPWKPETNTFSNVVLDETKKVFSEAKYGAIHAGLECGIIKEKFPDIGMASIGPNILYPHSNREKVELASVERVFTSLQNIVRRINED